MKPNILKFKKLVIAGNSWEIYDSFSYTNRFKNFSARSAQPLDNRNVYKSAWRALRGFSRLVKCNLYSHKQIPKFLTLTFSKNVQDLKIANPIFKNFIKRFNRYLGFQLKYVCVPEFQKSGRVHYHLILFNLPRFDSQPYEVLKKDLREKIWGGRVEFKCCDEGAIKYLTKYMTKDYASFRRKGLKRYFTSSGLYKPIVIENEVVVEQISWNLNFITSPRRFTVSTPYGYSSEHQHFSVPSENLPFLTEKLALISKEVKTAGLCNIRFGGDI